MNYPAKAGPHRGTALALQFSAAGVDENRHGTPILKRKGPLRWARLAAHRAVNLAFLDQAVASGGNFLSGILLARALGLHEFGRFAIAWMLVEFVGSLQFAAILQPMLNIGPRQSDADRSRYYHAVFFQQAGLCLLLGLGAGFCVMAAGRIFVDPALGELAAPIGAAIVVYQLSSFFRRYLFANGRPLAAVCNDALRFATQIAITVALPFAWPDATAGAGIWLVAAACLVAAVHGALFLGRPGWDAAFLRDTSVRHWQFAKWLLPSAVMYWMTSQSFMVMSGLVLGPAATGILKVAGSITGVLNLLLLALDNFAPIQASRALHTGGRSELLRYIARLTILVASLIAATVLALNIAPDYVVRLLYGNQYEGIGHVVRWLCAPAVIYGFSSVLVIWAAAIERPRIIFFSYVAATIFVLIAAYPLTHYAGIGGVVLGALLVELIRMVFLLVPLLQWSSAARSSETMGACPQPMTET